MHTNGADVVAHVAARVDELAAAQQLTARALEETWKPRLLELERFADLFLEILAAAATAAAELRREHSNHQRAVDGAREEQRDGDQDGA